MASHAHSNVLFLHMQVDDADISFTCARWNALGTMYPLSWANLGCAIAFKSSTYRRPVYCRPLNHVLHWSAKCGERHCISNIHQWQGLKTRIAHHAGCQLHALFRMHCKQWRTTNRYCDCPCQYIKHEACDSVGSSSKYDKQPCIATKIQTIV